MLTFSLPGALGMDRTQKPNKRLPQGKTFGLEFVLATSVDSMIKKYSKEADTPYPTEKYRPKSNVKTL